MLKTFKNKINMLLSKFGAQNVYIYHANQDDSIESIIK